jgi:hypothetical protein
MTMQRINRSEVELHTGDAALARALLDRIGRIYGPRIAPVLDRVCSELSAGEAPVRIDRLEVDLGTLAAGDVEDAFVARLEPALRAALQEALRRKTGGHRSARDSLELLEMFALTGGLPWWAPPDREVVARHFARASTEAGADLVALLGRIARDPGALDRIARLCGRNTLAALVERAQADQRRPAGQPSANPRVVDAARRQPRAEPTALDAPQAGARDIGHRDRAPSSELPGADPSPLGNLPASSSNAAAVDDATGAASSAASRGTDDGLRHRRQSKPAVLDLPQAGARDIGHRDLATSSDRSPGDHETGAASFALSPGTDGGLPHTRRAGLTPREPPRSPAQPRVEGVPAPSRTTARVPRALPAPTDPAAIHARRRGALARLDELYVEDAGLVILWPFLERLFLRAGVLGEHRGFLDEAAQLQAVALVNSLATADPAPLEFRLPLAKLLCGRSFESDFALERPLAPEQLAEGDRLLAAVIDRVPALGEPSIPELRAGFLARPGALGARDGAWLLQVERRPHDAVLDRFPWSWGWVRLPWMPGPLRVEW